MNAVSPGELFNQAPEFASRGQTSTIGNLNLKHVANARHAIAVEKDWMNFKHHASID